MRENEEVIIKTHNVRVRVLSLQPNKEAPWHFHEEIVDNIFCLSGTISIYLKSPDDQIILEPGQRCEVQARRVHRVANLGKQMAKYLLVQGVGEYDFNLVNS